MKHILLLTIFAFTLVASVIKSPILSIDLEKNVVTIKLDRVDPGVSGFIVHKISDNHTSILKNVVVTSYDKAKEIATLKMSEFNALVNNALPSGRWEPVVGDIVELAFGYNRSLLIAPSEEIYHRVTSSIKTQWVHSDIFAMVISYRGHPTPLKEDFEAMANASSVGLVFIYLDKRVYTVDVKSFKILNVSDAPLAQDEVKLPFYSRVEEIEANWWGEGSGELEEYEPHYYELLVANNPKNEKLREIIKNGDEKLHYLMEKFETGEENDR